MTPSPNVIQFNCQSCGTPLTVPAEMAGVTGPCPYCKATITSPRAMAPAAAVPANPFTDPHSSYIPSQVTAPAQPAMPQQAPQGQVPAQSLSQFLTQPQPQAQLPAQLQPQAQPQPQQPAVSPWLQGPTAAPAAPAAPILPGGDGMTGASWPPAATVVRGSGAHPVMDRLLHTPSPLPTVTPPYQERSSAPPKRRTSSSQKEGKRGAMWLAVLMAVLVLAGTSWFFRDQIRTAWLSYTLKDEGDDAPPTPPVDGGAAAKFDPSLKPAIKAIPIPDSSPTAPPVPTPTPDKDEPTTVRPALPAGSPTTPSPGSLVEIPGTDSPGPPVNVIPPPPLAPSMVTGVTPETQPAFEALQKFFHAKTWEERLPLVQAPRSMKPLMEKYYGTNPDGPLYPTQIQLIQHDKKPETGPPLCVFQVAGGGLRQPLPIMVDVTESGWKVDWLTFTEFKDELLLKFLESPQPEPARFHVLMRRAHYFEDDVPALDKKACFQIMPPMPNFTGDVFALKGSAVSKELDKHMGWEVNQAAAVVELQWRKEDRYQWVELTNLVQLNWRNVEPPLAPAPPAEPKEKEPVAPKVVPVD